MKIGIISGSHRSPSQSDKVANYINGCLADSHTETWQYSLANNPLPLWDQSIWENDPAWVERLTPIKKSLTECDGFIIISPEWHGQVPSGLKNFFLLFSNKELGHKPALLVSVSSGDGGAYPIAELRMSSYKNNRICYIPEQLILRHVESILNENEENNNAKSHTYYQARINWALDILIGYANALKPMRETTQLFNDKFNNGM
ncbi:MAG: NADPH-dependent FMN reductase [Gammaproteobacteria bacterium]